MDNSLNQATYDQLKKDILMFELKPGETVSAARVAERYSVSRTPAREALVKLDAEGLVSIIPQSKSIISYIDLSLARQEWFVRRSLEMGMVDRLFEVVDDEVIKEMDYHNNRMIECSHGPKSHENSYRYMLEDNAFHAVTYKAVGESVAEMVIDNYRAHYSRLRFLTDTDNSYQDRTIQGHTELISRLKEGDAQGYRNLLAVHLGHIINDIEDMEKKYPKFFTN